MPELVLLGDSIIDNKTYVAADEPDVPAQIAGQLPNHTVTMRAVDGFVAANVAAGLSARPVSEGASVFLSAGGNDALGSIGLLGDTDKVTFGASMTLLRGVREAFRQRYTGILNQIAGKHVLVATIYNPYFTGAEANLQVPAEGALSAFNDVIQQEALARGFGILDLRTLFDDPADYANPIEPSAIGGAKIADAVRTWLSAG